VDFSARYQADAEVTFQRLDEATVIVHLGTGRIHHTNLTGSRIWELLAEGRSLEDIYNTLLDEFDVPPEQLRSDLESFVQELSAEKMICNREQGP
jgi:hypothetical protein